MKADFDVVVIGAGMAGLCAAHTFQAAGKRVCILEKSRTLGGRMSTRVTNKHTGVICYAKCIRMGS